jgi:hypothetical protein
LKTSLGKKWEQPTVFALMAEQLQLLRDLPRLALGLATKLLFLHIPLLQQRALCLLSAQFLYSVM